MFRIFSFLKIIHVYIYKNTTLLRLGEKVTSPEIHVRDSSQRYEIISYYDENLNFDVLVDFTSVCIQSVLI